MSIEVELGGRRHLVQVQRGGPGWTVELEGRSVAADVAEAGGRWSVLIGHGSYEVGFEPRPGGELVVHINGAAIVLTVVDQRRRFRRRPTHDHVDRGTREGRGGHGSAAQTGRSVVTAPMPGRVVKVLVSPGDTVAARQAVVVIEAMKMENELRTRRAGTVTELRTAEGASVDAGAVLVVIE